MLKDHKIKSGLWFMTIVFLMTSLVFWGCDSESDDIPAGPAETVEGFVEQGWVEYANGQYQEAVTSFNSAASAQANNLEAYLGMGYAFAQLNELVRAKQNLQQVIGLSPVLVADSVITEELAYGLNAEAYAGIASVYLAERNYDAAIENVDATLNVFAEFEHRWINGFDYNQLKLIKAEAYFGAREYAECMFVLDDITGDFIANSSQINDTLEYLPVELQEDTWTTGVAELTLSKPNLIFPYLVQGTNLHPENIQNGEFLDWNNDDPVFWTVLNETLGDTIRVVSEVGEGEDHYGTGTGSCNIYNVSSEDLILLQDAVIPDEEVVLLKIDVSWGISGEIEIYNDDIFRGKFTSALTHYYSFETGTDLQFKLLAKPGSDITIDEISCKVMTLDLVQVISGFESGGDKIEFSSNPVPAAGGWYYVEYQYATDFGKFILELRDTIDSLSIS